MMQVEDLDSFINMALRLLGLEKVQHMMTQTKLAAAQEQLAILTKERDVLKAQIARTSDVPKPTTPEVN